MMLRNLQAALAVMLVTVVPLDARPATTVEIDFPGAVAVEAGMADLTPVDPNPQGHRRAAIVVPPGDSGTIYATTRADGTTVVRLVSDGQPAPAGFTRCGRYRAGDRLSFDTVALTVTPTTGRAVAGAMAQGSGSAGFSVGVTAGFGSGSLLDLVSETCAEIRNDLAVDCTGDDRGPVWAVGIDGRWMLNRLLDVGLRAEYSKPDDITLSASGSFENFPITTTATGSGSLWSFSGQVGVSPTGRVRLYSGFGGTRFDFDVTQTFSAFDQTETQTDSRSGWGRHFYAGAEVFVHPRLSIFGEGGRSWLKDDARDADDEDFDEAYSRWLFGVRLELATPRWRR